MFLSYTARNRMFNTPFVHSLRLFSEHSLTAAWCVNYNLVKKMHIFFSQPLRCFICDYCISQTKSVYIVRQYICTIFYNFICNKQSVFADKCTCLSSLTTGCGTQIKYIIVTFNIQSRYGRHCGRLLKIKKSRKVIRVIT